MSRDVFLGAPIDPSTGERRDPPIGYDADDLTTHAVIVGMTGSGKTGLGVVLLEELLRAGIPALVIDPKGDMGNLLLQFPELRPDDFAPWLEVDGDETRDAAAAAVAGAWSNGLASWGLGSEQLRALTASVDMEVYTPGSRAGTPLNVLGSFAAAPIDWDTHAEEARAEIEGLVSGILGMVGIEGDPLTCREHILLANLVERAWRGGIELDLASLIQQVMAPPIRKMGVFDLDVFFPPKDRQVFALSLNALLANPSFSSWIEGDPVDIDRMLWSADGKPRASIVYLSHLSAEERQFVVTLLMSKLATWMQGQAGSSRLRAVVYMDEVFGFVPPTSMPPSKKPILTLLKQARAFGLGVILSTQNPVDLDYKAMSNAGTWMVGRLQTERDKARILEALQSATGQADVDALDAQLGQLGKRQFLLHTTRSSTPTVFTTRWAMSYLRGPLTKSQLSRLPNRPVTSTAAPVPTPAPTPAAPGATAPASPAASAAPSDDTTVVRPASLASIPVRFLDPAAPWASDIGADPASDRVEAALSVHVSLLFDERRAGLDHREQWEAIFYPLGATFDVATAIAVDYDTRDFRPEPTRAVRYTIPVAPIDEASYFKTVKTSVGDYLLRTRELTMYRNLSLKLYSRVGETAEQFTARCAGAADERADEAAAKLRDKYERKLSSLERALDADVRKLGDAKADHRATATDTTISSVGSVIGAFFGGKKSVRRMASTATRVSSSQARRARSARRVESAQDRVEAKEDQIAALEEELSEEIASLHAKWQGEADAIESFEVGLEKNDIDVDEIALVWIPAS